MQKNNIDLNTVDQEVLESILAGVGPGLAARIIDYREQNGDFMAWDDLKRIPGMTNSMVDTLKQHGVILGRKVA